MASRAIFLKRGSPCLCCSAVHAKKLAPSTCQVVFTEKITGPGMLIRILTGVITKYWCRYPRDTISGSFKSRKLSLFLSLSRSLSLSLFPSLSLYIYIYIHIYIYTYIFIHTYIGASTIRESLGGVDKYTSTKAA